MNKNNDSYLDRLWLALDRADNTAKVWARLSDKCTIILEDGRILSGLEYKQLRGIEDTNMSKEFMTPEERAKAEEAIRKENNKRTIGSYKLQKKTVPLPSDVSLTWKPSAAVTEEKQPAEVVSLGDYRRKKNIKPVDGQ